MRLLIIRHGESEADLLDVHEGRADFPLTARGHKQAEAMASYLAETYEFDKIYCSTLRRAYQTAEHLSEKTGIPITADEHLMEFGNGLWAGLNRQTVIEKYPAVPNLPLHASVYEQESQLEFRFRAEYMLSKIVSENEDNATIAVVTHGGMIVQLYGAFLRLPVGSDVFWNTGDTGIHEWQINGDSRCVIRANYTGHAKGIES